MGVSGMDVQELWQGQGADRVVIGVVRKWRLNDRNKAADMLMKHLGGYLADNGQKQAPFAVALAEFIGQLHASPGGSRLPVRPPQVALAGPPAQIVDMPSGAQP
jgi:hypothetical protein